jgi:hypothetical protein
MSETTETQVTSTSAQSTAPSETSTATPSEQKVSSESPVSEKPALSQAVAPASTEGKKDEAKLVEEVAATSADEFEEYDLSLFEGSSLTEEDLNEIASEASRLNLSKEDAEKLLHLKDSAYKKAIAQKEQEYQAKIQEARKQIENDPDFVGDKKEQSFASISRAVQQFGDPDLVALLNTPDVGNNIVIAKFLKRIGDAIAPDSLPGKGVAAAPAEKNSQTLQNWYPEFFK